MVLGSNPNTESRYTQRTGGRADIWDVGFVEDGTWTVACRLADIGVGTVGWIARQGDGGNPALGGFIVCTGPPKRWVGRGSNGKRVDEWYVEGPLHGGWLVGGDDVAAAGWPDWRAPWGRTAVRQFRNGEEITPAELRALLDATPESLARAVALEYEKVTGRMPWWW
jgi:hypothetical protein